MVLFGITLMRARVPVAGPSGQQQAGRIWSYLGDVPKAFLMTVVNPGAVLGLIAIFGGIGSFVEVRGSVDALDEVVDGGSYWPRPSLRLRVG